MEEIMETSEQQPPEDIGVENNGALAFVKTEGSLKNTNDDYDESNLIYR